jgi:putative acetyltransferase
MMAKRKHEIVVRRAQVSDADALCAMFGSPRAMAGTLQLPFPSVETWRKRLADTPPEDYMLVAEVNGEIVGNAGLHQAGRARRKHAAGIGMSVRDDWHGRGVGSALLAAAIDIADNWLNYRRLELTVYTDNAAAIALYRKFGFEIEGTHRDYAYRNGAFVDAYAMARLRSDRDATRKSTKKVTK